MPGSSDALTGLVSENALEDLEVFTRHNGLNREDIEGWRRFIVRTFREDRHAPRDELRRHLRETRPEDTEEATENRLDEYADGLALLATAHTMRE